MNERHHLWLWGSLGGACLAGLVVAGVEAVRQDRHQAELIASGVCTMDREEWFQPPPSMVCTSYSNGTCTFWMPVQEESYRRRHWTCPDLSFWRRAPE